MRSCLTALDSIGILCNALVFILISVIAFRSSKHLIIAGDLDIILRLLFSVSLLSAFILTISSFVSCVCSCVDSSGHPHSVHVALFVNVVDYFSLFQCLLATLIYRLYISFAASIFKMSLCIQGAFLVTMLAMVLCAALALLCDWWYLETNEIWMWHAVLAFGFIYFIFFFMASACAVYIFTHNLYKLIQMQIAADVERFQERQG